MAPWHPLVDAVEGPTGAWHLVDSSGARIGRIELRRVMNGSDLRYRVEFRGEVIGWATTLRTACERLNQTFVRTHGPSGGAVASWEGPQRSGEAGERAGRETTARPAPPSTARPAPTARHDEGGRPRGRPPSPG